MKSSSYGNGTSENLSYNIQGWLTGISAKKGSTSIYNQTLRYYNPAKGTAALYSGNISEWATQQDTNTQETYGFTYDLQGRMTGNNRYSGSSTSAQSSYTERGITYDKNGNILTLQRYASALQDNYTYTYNGNRIASISGTNNGTAIASASYSYDNNGNTTTDGLKGLQISYNILNLPQTVTQGEAVKATYGWFADGSKYSVQDAQENGYCYIGSLIYSTTAGAAVLESTDFSGGRIVLSGNTQTILYHHKDHLGSVRAITDGSGSTIEQNAYYPFGGRHTFGQTYAQTTANRYKFNGKELQTTGNLGLLDYGARMYDAKTVRWMVQDPLAENYYPFSSYNYCVNNPVIYVDPDGKEIRIGKLLDNLVNFFTQNNFKEKVTNDLHTIASVNEELYSTLKSLHESDIVFYIVETDEGNKFERAYDNEILKQGIISYNINNRIGYDGKDRDPIAALAHELGHAINALEEKSIDYDKEKARHGEPKNVDKGNANEKRSIDFENFLRNYLNINERSYDYYKHKKNN